MRPTSGVSSSLSDFPFVNATSEKILLRNIWENNYIEVPQRVNITVQSNAEELVLGGVLCILETPIDIYVEKLEDFPLERKVLIVPLSVWELPDYILRLLRRKYGVSGIAIPEVYRIEEEKINGDVLFLVEALKIKRLD